LGNVRKADQPALGNRALTFPRVKEKTLAPTSMLSAC
jgi:hypothetical protein